MSVAVSKDEEISQVRMHRPHVVILGAGASIAALPKGDKNGKRLPSIDNFIDVLDLSALLSKAGVDFEGKNFEDIYDAIYRDECHSSLRGTLEQIVYDYFSSLELPDEPTIYDHLVLGLREKDVIATFNWDPFLAQAFRRNAKRLKVPRLYFLHGNVAIGHCAEDKVMGASGNSCSRCGRMLSPLKLLYPIREKNYHLDDFNSTQWRELDSKLKSAFMITIFGYRAPKSDVSAIGLLKDAWGNKYGRNLEQTEIINIQPENELLATWEPFVHTHHYDVRSDFYDSWIANHPRRTGEAWLNQFIDASFIEDNPIPRSSDFPELWDWCDRLREAEEQNVPLTLGGDAVPRYEHRVFRVKVEWDGGDYYLAAMIEKSEWMNVDHLGEKGWEFIAFVPNHEVYIRDSFSKGEQGELQYVRLAVFKRQMEEGEDMGWDATRAH